MTEPESGGSLNITSWKDLSSWMFYIMILLAVSMPLSEFGMSVAQFLLLFVWIVEGSDFSSLRHSRNKWIASFQIISKNIAGKFRFVASNYLLLSFIAIYILHLVGLLYSSDLSYALKDIRVKLPLLSIPILLATSTPLNNKRLNILLLFFTMAVIAGSLISMYVYLTQTIADPREISIFISHIRFALFISLSIFILLGFVIRNSFNNKILRVAFLLSASWLLIFLFILKSFTGLFITAVLFLVLIIISAYRYKQIMLVGLVLLLGLVIASWWYISDVYKSVTIAEPVELSSLDKYTLSGNEYIHDTAAFGIEKGSYVGLYIAPDELRNAWNERSETDFDGLDKKGEVLKYTLIRFLHSKGNRKDAEAVRNLSDEEINQIENGLANAGSMKKLSLRPYLEQLLMGYNSYRNQSNPNGSSLMQRLEYWKTSLYLIKHKPISGFGTGDVRIAFDKAYEETNSPLLPEFRHRSHNQFFAITVALGLIGLIVFLFSLLHPPLKLGKFNNYYYLVFFIIVVASFLTEDTLETQAGATFFAFFSALFLFGIRKEADIEAKVVYEKHKKISGFV